MIYYIYCHVWCSEHMCNLDSHHHGNQRGLRIMKIQLSEQAYAFLPSVIFCCKDTSYYLVIVAFE